MLKQIFCLIGLIFMKGFCLRQLSFSGGGSLGAVEIGILKKIVEIEPQIEFDLYTGISAGAINSGMLSYFDRPKDGVAFGERIYEDLKNHQVYEMFPSTGFSLLNTRPLYQTLTSIILEMDCSPKIRTLIGATNLYSGRLDIFEYREQDLKDQIATLMASSAIPVIFPPVSLKNGLYADGGILSNELFDVEHHHSYINITFITPKKGLVYNDTVISTLPHMIRRTLQILYSNYDNPLMSLNQNCKKPIGEIHKYFVSSGFLENQSIYDFNHGKPLIEIGYNHMEKETFKIC